MNFETLRLEMVYKPISELLPYARNPRKNDDAVEKGASFIKEFGFSVPILMQSDGTIIDGHLRLKCAKRLGMKELPVIIRDDMTEAQIRAFRLSVNRFAELADWDQDMLKIELMELDNLQYDIDLLGFDVKLDEDNEGTDGLTDPDEVPEVPQNVFGVKRGDVWLLGNHRIMCGDSTSEDDVKKLMDDKKADMVFTDPPYGMKLDTDYTGMNGTLADGSHIKRNKHKQVIGDHGDFKPELITTVLKMFSYCDEIFLWGADYYAELLPERNEGSWVVWDKTGNEQRDGGFGSSFELCWSKNRHKRTFARIWWQGIFGVKDDQKTRVHPTQKPVQLVEWFFERWGKEAKSVVDLFLGSGSTLIACEKTGRTCYGMELDEHYCSVIINRWQDFTGKTAIKEESHG